MEFQYIMVFLCIRLLKHTRIIIYKETDMSEFSYIMEFQYVTEFEILWLWNVTEFWLQNSDA